MKALTLTQPWASLVALGKKKIETRSWRTPYRGALAIHAAKGFPKWAQETCLEDPFWEAFGAKPLDIETRKLMFNPALPVGKVVATCRLISCLPTRELQRDGRIETDLFANSENFEMTELERAFGDYSEGRWAWLLADIKPLAIPVEARGALSLWDWEAGELSI
jgi:hypothetical protein